MVPFVRAGTLRWGSCLAALLLAAMVSAQSKFVINGRLKVDGGGLDGCRMVVYKNGGKDRTISADLNRFSLELDLGANYILSFEKSGFVTKKLQFNTRLPATATSEGLTPFQFVVSLFKQYEGMNTVVFNQPVGMIRYDPMQGDFDYDTDYTKSIQSALAAAQAEVERKQQEEARAEDELAKQQQQQAKKQAKQQAAEDKAKAEEAKVAQQLTKAEPKPTPEPKPAPATAVVPAPKPERAVRAPAPVPARPGTLPKPAAFADVRRETPTVVQEESSRVQLAAAHGLQEPRPKFEPAATAVVRHQDVIVNPYEVVTVIKLEQGPVVHEYRRVVRKYSGVFYFKNGRSCSQLTYEQEALAERDR